MQDPTKLDYSKLLGFDMVADDVTDGVDFQNAMIGTRLGAKVGKMGTLTPGPMKSADLPSEATGAGEPIMVGLGGRTVAGA